MVWLVVTVNGVFYFGNSLQYVKLERKRYAKISDCTMVDSRHTVQYPSAHIHLRYVVFARKVKLKVQEHRLLLKWFKQFSEYERLRK